MKSRRQQSGAFMVMMAIMLAVLIGFAALALDVGRVFVLRAEMQNAADAAALAAAAELNGKSGARLRARAAARQALVHEGHHARVAELLGDTGLPDEAFAFFCIIGSKDDVDPDEVDMSTYCSGADDGTGKWPATTDDEAHYVRVTLDPDLAANYYTVDLIFLPVLKAVGIDPANFVQIVASAMAGRHWYECNYPPMVLCDPFEGTGTTFKEAMQAGQAIVMREQGPGAAWVSGNFGFLEPRDGGGGANVVARYLASADLMGCTPPRITTKTGEMAQKTKAAINTRFDQYGPQLPKPPDGMTDWQAWPPAPNIAEYPLDSTWQTIAGVPNGRFGTGQWPVVQYWQDKYGTTPPMGWNDASPPKRWEVYQYEIANPDPAHPVTPSASHMPWGDAERRVLYVAVASCEALGIGGKSDAVLNDPDGFARIFLIQKAQDPSDKLEIYGEYEGWSMEQDAHYHVDLQLYE